ncbi:MAG: hypothetical protein RLY57_339 [Candidatus Parcubacteria bacterium]|jgi:broad specificity phosphatase PhoE
MNLIYKILAWLCGYPMNLYVTRHGESHRNHGLSTTQTGLFFDTEEQFTQWGLDADQYVPLTEQGLLQARAAGATFIGSVIRFGIMPSVIIHSGYQRAFSTAQEFVDCVCRAGYPYIELVENFSIRERESGITHVLLAHEVESLMTWNKRYWSCVGPVHARPWSGESLIEMREGRIRTFLDRGLKKYAGQSVVVVCHGRVMQTMHMELLGMSLSQMEAYMKEPSPKNCEIRHYRFDWRTRRMVYVGVVV